MRITLGAGESRVVSVAGGRFYYEAGGGKISVRTMGNDSNVFELSPGMGFQNKESQVNFPSVEITNLVGAQDIDFIISYREVFDHRVYINSSAALDVSVVGGVSITGQVDVNDEKIARVDAKKVYGAQVIRAAVADKYSVTGFYNILQDKPIYIDKIVIPGGDGRDAFNIVLHNNFPAVESVAESLAAVYGYDFSVAGIAATSNVSQRAFSCLMASSSLSLSYTRQIHYGRRSVSDTVVELGYPVKLDYNNCLMVYSVLSNTPIESNFVMYAPWES